MRYAAIDIGSNAIRLLIADIIENEKTISFKKNTFIRVPLRLGHDAFTNKQIPDEKVKDLVKSMIAFSYLIKVFDVQDYMACATSAMREAKNGPSIVKKIKKKTGLNIEIIRGKHEANIIYSTHLEQHLERKKNYLYIDVGGGSTELSFFSNGEIICSNSFNIGTIRILSHQYKDEAWTEMKSWIREKIGSYKNIVGIGTGGNINKLYQMIYTKGNKPMEFAKLKKMNAYLNAYSIEDRIKILGLNPDRADVIIPASEIYLKLMQWANIKQLVVPRLGLVDGIIQQLIEKNDKRSNNSTYKDIH